MEMLGCLRCLKCGAWGVGGMGNALTGPEVLGTTTPPGRTDREGRERCMERL